MTVNYNPRIVTDGLVIYLDPANVKGYDEYENLLRYSNNFSNGLWGGYCGNKDSIVYNTTDVISPDGTYNSTKIVKTVNVCNIANPAFGLIWSEGQQVINKTDTYTASIYVRGAVGGESVVIGLADSRAQTYTLTTSWKRITYTGINDTTDYNTARSFQIAATGSNVTYYIWGAQVESGPSVNDYYATTTTSKTRGSTIIDLSQNANDGSLVNGTGYSELLGGGSLYFDGANDFVFAADTTINPLSRNNFFTSYSQQITIESWVYVPTTTSFSSGTRGIVTRGNSGDAYGLRFTGIESGNNTEVSAYFSQLDGPSTNVCQSVGNITKGVWNQLNAVWTGNSSLLYINSDLIQTTSTPTVTGNTDNSTSYQIGRESGIARRFNGNMSAIKIYNKALTASEIRQNFNALRGRFGI